MKTMGLAGKKMNAEDVKLERRPASGVLSAIYAADATITEGLKTMAQTLANQVIKPGPLAMMYLRVDREWTNALKAIREEIRDRLMSVAKEAQKQDGVESVRADFDRATFDIKYSEVLHSKPDSAEFSRATGLSLLAFCRQVVSYEVDEGKLAELLRAEKVTQKQVDDCRKVFQKRLVVTKL